MITPARDGWRCRTPELLINCWWERQMVQPFSNRVQQFLIKLTMQPAYDPAVVLVNVYPTKVQAYVHIGKFIVVLFVLAQNWKQLWHSSTGEWLNKPFTSIPWDSALNERNQLLIQAETWMNLQSEKEVNPEG